MGDNGPRFDNPRDGDHQQRGLLNPGRFKNDAMTGVTIDHGIAQTLGLLHPPLVKLDQDKGNGQLVQGRILAAFLFFLFAGALWLISFGTLGWIMHLWAALNAALWKP